MTQLYNQISEKTLDYFIEDLQFNYRTTSKDGYNILMTYIAMNGILHLDRIIYWIEKRKIDPWDCNNFQENIFDLFQRRINDGMHIIEEVRQYLFSLKDKRTPNVNASMNTKSMLS